MYGVETFTPTNPPLLDETNVYVHRLQERVVAAEERSCDLEATLREERQRTQTLERRYDSIIHVHVLHNLD